jgi:hypothetical protein
MNAASPDLLTLLHWATQMAAGQKCAEWESWCATSPDAARKWEQIAEAQELLDGGIAIAVEDDCVSAEVLAAFIEGRLDPAEAERVEQRLWQSPEQLAEVLSSLRFAAQAHEPAETARLHQRLVALVPQSMNGHAQAAPVLYRLAPPEAKKSKWLAPVDRPMAAIVLPDSRPSAKWPKMPAIWSWLTAAAALLIIATAGGAIGWLTWGRRNSVAERPMVKSLDIREAAPRNPREARQEPTPVVPQETQEVRPSKAPQSPPQPDVKADSPAKTVAPARPVVNEIPAASPIVPQQTVPQQPQAPMRASSPSPAARRARLSPPELAFESAQGILLLDSGSRGKWRVANGRHVLNEPLKMASLAESWTTAEVSGVATLVCEGSTELALSRLIDGVLEVRLDRGRVGLKDIADGAEIRVLVADAAWTARGLEPHSMLAVFHDPLSPGIAVPQGAIALDEVPIETREFLRWQQDRLVPFELVTPPGAADPNAPPAAEPLIHQWDLEWLSPPDEARRKQWQAAHGRLVDRLAEANDFEAELARMLATSRDVRQAALLARWSAASEPPVSRAKRIWSMMRERRAPVRVAGVMSLLELPPGDLRREEVLTLCSQTTNQATRVQVEQWLDGTRQPMPLAQTQAADLVSHLTHEELAVRQIAASLLELHTATALLQSGRLPPLYDATSSANRRAAAQQEWRSLLRQLFNAARNANGLLGPSTPKPVQP